MLVGYPDIYAQNGVITTFAGTGVGGYSGDGGPAILAKLDTPAGVATDGLGNVFIIDAAKIRKVDSAGIITTIAGDGTSAFSGDGGLASAAKLKWPRTIKLDAAGNIYIVDENRVRKINTSGIITTIAGNGLNGFSGDGGAATLANLWSPMGIAIDNSGNVYISDTRNNRIRMVNTSGIITTVAGSAGVGYSGDGGAATIAKLWYPVGITFDNSGNLIFADRSNSCIRKVTTAGIISTIAGNGINGLSGDGKAATLAQLYAPADVCVNKDGDIFISDELNYRIRKIANDGIITTIAGGGSGINYGDNGYAITSTFRPWAIASDSQNSIFFTDRQQNRVKKIEQLATINFYFDQNNNCVKDTSDYDIYQPVIVIVDSNNITIDTISATGGFSYRTKGKVGDIFKFMLISVPSGLMASCPSSGIVLDTIHSANGNFFTASVGLSCSGISGFDLEVLEIHTRSGPHRHSGDVYFANNTCNDINATINTQFSPKYLFQNANPNPTSSTSNSITWNFPALGSIRKYPYHVFYHGPSNGATGYLTIGDTVHTSAMISPVLGDNDTSNNYMVIVDTVKAGYDPNDIQVKPSGYIFSGTKLEYTIRFENTGNDTAFNIFVLDSLSDFLEPRSFRILFASAAMKTTMLHSTGYNILKFDFPNINLLDSSHHGECNGSIKFTINVKDGIPWGTIIPNHAGIYFDFNPVVITNTVENIIGFPTKTYDNINGNNIQIFPNPTDDVLNIISTEKITSIVIKNVLGQSVYTSQYNAKQVQINTSKLPTGVYFINVNDLEIRKFLKE